MKTYKVTYKEQKGEAVPAQEYYSHPKYSWVKDGSWVFFPNQYKSEYLIDVSKSSLTFEKD